MSIAAMNANQHLADTLRGIADTIENHAATLPAPTHTRVVLDFDDPDKAAAWARQQLGCGTRGDDHGRVTAEKWIDSAVAIQVQADGDGTL